RPRQTLARAPVWAPSKRKPAPGPGRPSPRSLQTRPSRRPRLPLAAVSGTLHGALTDIVLARDQAEPDAVNDDGPVTGPGPYPGPPFGQRLCARPAVA